MQPGSVHQMQVWRLVLCLTCRSGGWVLAKHAGLEPGLVPQLYAWNMVLSQRFRSRVLPFLTEAGMEAGPVPQLQVWSLVLLFSSCKSVDWLCAPPAAPEPSPVPQMQLEPDPVPELEVWRLFLSHRCKYGSWVTTQL